MIDPPPCFIEHFAKAVDLPQRRQEPKATAFEKDFNNGVAFLPVKVHLQPRHPWFQKPCQFPDGG
jgi:hypothetical protein